MERSSIYRNIKAAMRRHQDNEAKMDALTSYLETSGIELAMQNDFGLVDMSTLSDEQLDAIKAILTKRQSSKQTH